VGTLTDALTDYRMINESYEFRFQYQDNLVSYGDVGSDIYESLRIRGQTLLRERIFRIILELRHHQIYTA
jgi:hypothetical protein